MRLVDPVIARLAASGLRVVLRIQGPRRISAMMRIRDEEEFLDASVRSIIDLVDEVVLVDNLSTDRTPEIIDALRRAYPGKVVTYSYPHAIRSRGREHWELASSADGLRSPHLTSTYYNWCLARCTHPYVLKWDGDMIATDELAGAIDAWRGAGAAVLTLVGANVHADRAHVVGARSADRATIARALTVPVAPSWVSSMTYTYAHPHLFPRFGARFEAGDRRAWWTETFASPFLHPRVEGRLVLPFTEPTFLHLKFCKRDPYAGYSDDFAGMIDANMEVGPPLTPEWRALMRRWGVSGA